MTVYTTPKCSAEAKWMPDTPPAPSDDGRHLPAVGLGLFEFIVGAAVYAALFLLGPFLLSWLGIVDGPEGRHVIPLAVAAAGALSAMFFESTADGRYNLQRLGLQCCVIALGAAIAGLALSFTSEEALLSKRFLGVAEFLGLADGRLGALALFFLLMLAAMLGGLFCANIAMRVRESRLGAPAVWTIVMGILGSVVMLGNIYTIILSG